GGETVAQVVVRKLKVELGLNPLSMWATEYVVHFYEPVYDKVLILPLIVAVVDPESQVKLSPEVSSFRWLPPGKARHLVSWKNLERMIEEITDELEIFPARNWVQITA
ncbi:MAG TPA: NUDIX domain-containing protein, partial [candidate division Zixibacteria bacterium]|nr:NUDIX domain-containing protein [candidate division Zixibacteria bacterium]